MQKKTYKKIKVILDNYSFNSNIKVYYKSLNGQAQWQPANRTIYLDIDVNEYDKEIANYLHELGHMRDDYMPKSSKQLKQIENAYNRCDLFLEEHIYISNNQKVKMTENQKLIVLNIEYNAWINGIAIANQLNINLGKWYKKQMLEALEIYFEHFYNKDYKNKMEEFLKEKNYEY